MSKRTLNTIIGEGSVFRGTFKLNNSIEIKGTFSGNIKSNEDITITRTGKVKTNIKARNVIVAGELEGNIDALSSVTIHETGKVKGDIVSPNLKIDNGAVTYGKVSINEEEGLPSEVKLLENQSFSSKSKK